VRHLRLGHDHGVHHPCNHNVHAEEVSKLGSHGRRPQGAVVTTPIRVKRLSRRSTLPQHTSPHLFVRRFAKARAMTSLLGWATLISGRARRSMCSAVPGKAVSKVRARVSTNSELTGQSCGQLRSSGSRVDCRRMVSVLVHAGGRCPQSRAGGAAGAAARSGILKSKHKRM